MGFTEGDRLPWKVGDAFCLQAYKKLFLHLLLYYIDNITI
jgi:hypothetical protein